MVKIASTLCLTTLLLGVCLPAQEISGKKNPELIMDEEAFDSLFKKITEGPQALPQSERASFLAPSGLSAKELDLLIESANRYRAALNDLSKKSEAIKTKAKAEGKPVAPQMLAEIGKTQFDSLLQTIAAVRQNLEPAKYQKLLTFLNTHVKPTIVIAAPKEKT